MTVKVLSKMSFYSHGRRVLELMLPGDSRENQKINESDCDVHLQLLTTATPNCSKVTDTTLVLPSVDSAAKEERTSLCPSGADRLTNNREEEELRKGLRRVKEGFYVRCLCCFCPVTLALTVWFLGQMLCLMWD